MLCGRGSIDSPLLYSRVKFHTRLENHIKRWTGEIPAGPDNYQYKIKRGEKLNSQTMNSDTSTINNTN